MVSEKLQKSLTGFAGRFHGSVFIALAALHNHINRAHNFGQRFLDNWPLNWWPFVSSYYVFLTGLFLFMFLNRLEGAEEETSGHSRLRYIRQTTTRLTGVIIPNSSWKSHLLNLRLLNVKLAAATWKVATSPARYRRGRNSSFHVPRFGNWLTPFSTDPC